MRDMPVALEASLAFATRQLWPRNAVLPSLQILLRSPSQAVIYECLLDEINHPLLIISITSYKRKFD